MRTSSWTIYAALSIKSVTVSGFSSAISRTTRGASTLAYTSPSFIQQFGVTKSVSVSPPLCMTYGDRRDNSSYRNNNSYDGDRYSSDRRSSPSSFSNSNGHDYVRDTSNDNSNVDIDAVNSMLGERLRARKQGDFKTADAIRDELVADYKVTVFDKDKIWVTGYRRGIESANRGGTRGRDGRGTIQRRSNRDFRSDFGPNGHDYNLCSKAGSVSSAMSEPEIHGKVAERLMAKMNRDFETADRVQLELAEEGVYINDKTKEWRADGVRFIDPSEGRRVPSDPNRPYVQSRHSLPLPENVRREQIDRMILDRIKCKQFKKFMEADRVREILLEKCNVVLDDRVREWSVGGSFGKAVDLKRAHSEAMKSRDYVRSSASLELPDGVTENEVQGKVDARMKARMNRQYHESDVLREELLQRFDVVIHDTIKMWSVGGDFGTDDPDKLRAKELSTYTRRGGGVLFDDEVLLIQDMLTKRFEAKRTRNFQEADEIRSHLYNTYKINIDDKSREWRVLSDDYAQTEPERGARELPIEYVTLVETEIARRAVFKKNKKYEKADAIRDELQETYSVLIDDKKKEWKVVASSSSRGNSKFAQEAVTSQLSAYKQKQMSQQKADNDDELDSNFVQPETKKVEDELDTLAIDSPSSFSVTADESEQGDVPSVLTRDVLTSLTVPLLKEKLREVGKPMSGRKAELIDRLLA